MLGLFPGTPTEKPEFLHGSVQRSLAIPPFSFHPVGHQGRNQKTLPGCHRDFRLDDPQISQHIVVYVSWNHCIPQIRQVLRRHFHGFLATSQKERCRRWQKKDHPIFPIVLSGLEHSKTVSRKFGISKGYLTAQLVKNCDEPLPGAEK